MKGYAKFLHELIEGHKIQFIVPVYQRHYDWRIDNCDQLIRDIVKLQRAGGGIHFFGSVVTASAGSDFSRLVIDGQQRLTTISLLLMAGIKAAQLGHFPVMDRSRLDEAREIFLDAKYANSNRRIKLIPLSEDLSVYDRVYAYVFHDGAQVEPSDSKVARNFLHFYETLTRVPSLSFDWLLDAVERLQIISIELDPDDNAQEIFESLNSTGVALTEADKIRNYLLMSIPPSEQQECFQNYWMVIERATHGDPTRFLRDYLTIKQKLKYPISESNIYREWKRYMESRDRKQELMEIAKYARYQQQISEGVLSSERLSRKMRHICNIESEVTHVFFLQFFQYADEHGLSEDDIYRAIDLVENYMARRIICHIHMSGLAQLFCSLHRDVLRSIEESRQSNASGPCAYPEILIYHILRRKGIYELPSDFHFREAIQMRNVYRMSQPQKIFLFERLENAMRTEYNDVATEMRAGEATIEHVMPQKLSPAWKSMLGERYAEIHEKYLHTFANLTLSGINSELGNRAFEVKRDGEGRSGKNQGYRDSKYRLTSDIAQCEKWTETELEERGKRIAETFLRLYPIPVTQYVPEPKSSEEISLDDEDFSPVARHLKGFRLMGEEFVDVSMSWKAMLLAVVQKLESIYPDIVDSICSETGMLRKASTEDENLRKYYSHIGKNLFVKVVNDSKQKISFLRGLFRACDVPESELVMLLVPEG